ncbi:prostaglandin E2 receptor EP2 subtype [Anolis sagrei]|uniref:prostaglandin E2 receptor EP2 subtype n=1 Tax=Anolis sagrei TaxID=38937 RepID=UPI003522E564
MEGAVGSSFSARGHCESLWALPPGESPVISAVMFSAGLVGNVWALALLGRAWLLRRRRRRFSSSASSSSVRTPPFRALLSALVLTDLLGTCLLSPAVLWAYATGRTLVALDGGQGRLCLAFAFGMSFFALATLACLGAMALERSLALGAPYLYARLLGGAPAWLPWAALLALYAFCAALCAAPLLLGFGRFVQYCPGTWCFLQMRFQGEDPEGPGGGGAPAFALLYAALLLLLVLAVLLGNLSLMVSLVRMRRRGRGLRLAGTPPASSSPPPHLSMAQEADHLILLSIMTLTFAVCSLPFAIRAFMNNFLPESSYEEDLRAMRFLSVNSIIDPWVFAILRPPVLRMIRSMFCCRTPFKARTKSKQASCVAKQTPAMEVDICHP